MVYSYDPVLRGCLALSSLSQSFEGCRSLPTRISRWLILDAWSLQALSAVSGPREASRLANPSLSPSHLSVSIAVDVTAIP